MEGLLTLVMCRTICCEEGVSLSLVPPRSLPPFWSFGSWKHEGNVTDIRGVEMEG
jgi:hypothetical protein